MVQQRYQRLNGGFGGFEWRDLAPNKHPFDLKSNVDDKVLDYHLNTLLIAERDEKLMIGSWIVNAGRYITKKINPAYATKKTSVNYE